MSVYESQLLTYLRPGGWRLGLLISFNDAVFKDGIRRKIMGYDSAL
ncbi:MAG: GxxExxY protein [Acidobacteriota bacterium]|nr:GxxExxY protein [Acidobacteriota bacterium]